jgi:tape measure domain-containing protein
MANKLNASLVLDTAPFERSIRRMSITLDRMGKQLQNTGTALTQNLTVPIAGMGAAALKAFSDMEKLEKGLGAVMGGSEAAAIELENLKEAAKAPGLGFEEAVRGSIRLQAVGLSADEARGTLQAFGAAIAATGGTAQNLDSVQYQLTQMISKNRILQEDFGILQENVPLLGKAVENAFGTQNIELIRKTGISAKEFTDRITEALAALPETQAATGGLGNAFDNLQDELKFSFAELGRVVVSSVDLEGIMVKLADAVQGAVDWFKQLNPETQRTIVIIAAIVAGIGPLLIGLGSFIQLLSFSVAGIGKLAAAFTFLTGPVGLVVAAIGLVTLAFATANKTIDANLAARQKLLEVDKQAKESILAEKLQVERLIGVIKSENSSREEKIKALNRLKEISPAYFGQIKDEKDLVIDATKAYSDYAKNLLITSKIKAAESNLVDLEKQLLNVAEASEPTFIQKLGASIRTAAKNIGSFNSLGNAFTYANEVGTVFGNNIKNNTNSLEAQTAALRKYIEELEKSLNTQNKAAGGGGGGGGTITAPTIQTTAPTANLQALRDIGAKAVSSVNSVRSALASLEGGTPVINNQKEALLAYEKGLQGINAQATIFGGDVLSQQFKLTEDALSSAITQFALGSEAVAVFAAQYEFLKNQVAEVNAETEKQQRLGEFLVSTISSIGQSFSEAASGAISFGQAVKRVLIDTISLLIQQYVATVIKNSADSPLGKLLGPAIVPVSIAAGAAAGQLAKALLGTIKLAKGGLVTGETLALIGDNPSGKEAVIPFERMGEFLNMFQPQGGYIAETRISGEDLLILVNRAERRNNRVR